MEFDLTETQKLFQRSARELFTQELPGVLARETAESNVDHSSKMWSHLQEQGWTGLIFPEELGGQGLGMVELAVAFEEMGRALVPGPFLSTVPLAGALIERLPKNAHRDNYLKSICDGTAKATVAIMEDDASWGLDSLALTASESSDGVKLSGKKLFVTDAAEADLILVPARIGTSHVVAVVKKGASGTAITPMPGIDSLRPLYQVVFESTPAADVLARGDAASSALAQAVDVATLALAAEMVGGMQFVLDATVEYAKTRKQFGKPIGQFQAIQHHCADMLLMTESARSAVYYAAWAMESEPESGPLAVSVAKAYASDSYREVGNLGIQTHGGIGFTWDHELHFYYKRAKSAELLFGDATYHRERIAKLVIDGQTATVGLRAADAAD
ncbi:MAG TPA: acyl-CoA dehydrogenase family protein [Blastocatellia bacterium]|nr:acyl-CoA dehydrogenase family protein [Blastocatellia bacterium]